MATEKDFNQSSFTKIAKETEAFAQMIKSTQDQKQIVIDDFERERKRFKAGKIAKKSLISSVPRVRKEIQRLDGQIRKNIKGLNKTAEKIKRFSVRQSPKKFRVSISGVSLSGGKKRKHRSHKKSRGKKK